ncbi:MAG: DUF2341 domain-containing protein, partial [bacterium]
MNTVFAADPWYDASWLYRTKITVDRTKVASSTGAVLTNFPILVSTTSISFKDYSRGGSVGKAGGGDILFTAADGTTALNYEIETYSSSTGQIVAWVKIPTLATSTNTDIYMYYGNATATDPIASVATGVWNDGGSNYFKGVWHLPNGVSLGANDSTANAKNGTINAGVTATTGQVGGSGLFNGSSGYINGSAVSPSALTTFTVSAWVKRNGNQSINSAVVADVYTSAVNYSLYFNGATTLIGGFYNGSWRNTSAVTLSNGVWTYVVYTYDGAKQRLYTNDNVPLETSLVSTPTSNNLGYRIGRRWDGGNYVNGSIDEVRISSGARSADWIRTEYNNQSSPSTFSSFAVEEVQTSTPGAVPIPTATIGNSQVSLVWSAPSSSGGSAVTDYVIEYKLTSTSTWSIFADGASTVTSGVVTGLINGSSYDF